MTVLNTRSSGSERPTWRAHVFRWTEARPDRLWRRAHLGALVGVVAIIIVHIYIVHVLMIVVVGASAMIEDIELDHFLAVAVVAITTGVVVGVVVTVGRAVSIMVVVGVLGVIPIIVVGTHGEQLFFSPLRIRRREGERRGNILTCWLKRVNSAVLIDHQIRR
jgi:hypothetical protein